MADQLAQIEHVVVLMLENRSFDHMLGYLYADHGNVAPSGQPFDGLTGNESNPDPSGTAVKVHRVDPGRQYAYFVPGADPGEGYSATNSQLFDNATAPSPPVASNSGFVKNFASTLAWEQKNPRWKVLAGTVPSDIMACYPPEMLPVLSALARGYAVSDRWFSPVPTETMPNRAFACAATSQGHMDDRTKTFTSGSIFGALGAKNLGWSIYGYSSDPLTRLNFPDTTNAPETHFGKFPDFQAAAAAGTLPPFTFLEPAWSSAGNSQHPNYDVALGEQLIHDVYAALRGGKGWNQTLLVITYDEHGGCYDHVPPPAGATPPDSSAGEFGFDFTRFGVRVPAVLVSPLIPAGTVFRAPEGGPPLDHTSILKTVERRWGLSPLTARDRAAADLGPALSLAAARTDDVLQGVVVPRAAEVNPLAGEPSHLQQIHAELASLLPVPDELGATIHRMPSLRTAQDYDDYIRTRTEAWKANRARRA